jgi:peptide/nickel transport system permease protein
MPNRAWLMAILAAVLLLGPLIVPYDPARTDAGATLQPPGAEHPLGTDAFGRDVLSRIITGGQRTLLQAAAATALALLLGTITGLTSTFAPRLVAQPARAVSAALLAVPQLVWSLAILALLGPGPGPLVVALAVPLMAPVAVVSRSAFQSVAAEPFVTAAYAIGLTKLRIVIYYIIPNSTDLLFRYTAVIFTYAILNGAGLAFLGFSEPGTPEWGAMLNEARLSFRTSPWPAMASGIAIAILVWAALSVSREVLRSRQ